MASFSRTRLADELFDNEATPETRTGELVQAAFPDSDFVEIAGELGVPGDQVSFVIHGEGRDRRGWPTTYKLVGTAGPGEAYDPLQDRRALDRATLNTLTAGAASITGAAAKKS
jgi:hypothetical protein